MTVQTLNVLINLAERCRKNGLIKFEEFSLVETAIKEAVDTLNELNAPETTDKVQTKKSKP